MSAFSVVEQFEAAVAEYTGARHVVAVDRCRNALFLCCLRLRVSRVTLPARTYISTPAYVLHAGGSVAFEDYQWSGAYWLDPYPIVDAARRFRRGMFHELHAHHPRGAIYVGVSFQYKKPLKIGRGGAILTDDEDAAAWFRRARHDGRTGGVRFADDVIPEPGWGFDMAPEAAARGLSLLEALPDSPLDCDDVDPDLRECAAFREQA